MVRAWEACGFTFRQVEKEVLEKHQNQESSRVLTCVLALFKAKEAVRSKL